MKEVIDYLEWVIDYPIFLLTKDFKFKHISKGVIDYSIPVIDYSFTKFEFLLQTTMCNRLHYIGNRLLNVSDGFSWTNMFSKPLQWSMEPFTNDCLASWRFSKSINKCFNSKAKHKIKNFKIHYSCVSIVKILPFLELDLKLLYTR